MISNSRTAKYYNELVSACDELIKAGNTVDAAKLLENINVTKVPRDSRLLLAKQCRRVGVLAELGLRLLYPVIYNQSTLEKSATEAEKCEYAALLNWSDLSMEAMSILASINEPTIPEVTLYKAYCYTDTWNYELAVEYFEAYIRMNLDPYGKLLGRVNLAGSFARVDRLDEAEELLSQILPEAEKMNATRLIGNIYEIRGKVYFFRGQYKKAKKDLEMGLEYLNQGHAYDQFHVKMWLTIVDATENKSTEGLKSFRAEALRRRKWVSVQEADWYILKLEFNQKQFDHLYFGNPFPGYRQRIRREFPQEPSSQFVLGNPGGMELDLLSGKIFGSKILNPGRKIHQAIAALLADFYNPRSIGSLFITLYPGEVFNVNSSPMRVHQILRRTRRWFEVNNIPAVITQEDGFYRLEITGDFAIRIPLDMKPIDPYLTTLAELKGHFPPGNKFSAQEACLKLKISRSAFHRFVDSAMRSGALLRTGSGKLTVHEIIDVPA